MRGATAGWLATNCMGDKIYGSKIRSLAIESLRHTADSFLVSLGQTKTLYRERRRKNMRSSTSRVLRDRLFFFLPFKGYRVLSKTSIACGALVPCLWAWLSSYASSRGPCLSLVAMAMRRRQHVSTSLLHTIGIHEGEPMSTTWLTRRRWPFAARDKTGRGLVPSGPPHAVHASVCLD